MILVLHRLEIVEEEALLCFGEIRLIVALSIIRLTILALKLKKLVVGIGYSQVFMDIQKSVEEEIRGILYVVLLDRLLYHGV
jgi:hypothetical protein